MIRIFKAVFTNKYIVATIVTLLIIVFFDNNSCTYQLKNKKKIKELEAQENYYLEEIRKDKESLKKMSDPKFLEKIGREEYLMKSDKEDVFIIVFDSITN